MASSNVISDDSTTRPHGAGPRGRRGKALQRVALALGPEGDETRNECESDRTLASRVVASTPTPGREATPPRWRSMSESNERRRDYSRGGGTLGGVRSIRAELPSWNCACTTRRLPSRSTTRRSVLSCRSSWYSSFERAGCEIPRRAASSDCDTERASRSARTVPVRPERRSARDPGVPVPCGRRRAAAGTSARRSSSATARTGCR